MKYKIGDIVYIIDNNSAKFVIAKSKFENLTEANLRLLTVKTNIIRLDIKILNIELGNFDYLIIQSYPTPIPKEIETPNYKLITSDDIL